MSLAERGLAGAALILAIVALRAAAGRALPRRALVALWWAAVARLVLPWRVPCGFSVYTLTAKLRPVAASWLVPIAPAAGGAAAVGRVLPGVALPAAGAAGTAAAGLPVPSAWALAWLGGGLLLGARFTAAYVRLRRKYRVSLPAESACVTAWLQGHPALSVRVSDQISSPLVCGLLHPAILLPKRMDWGDETALAHILTHEHIHIRRMDGLTKLILAGTLCLHWWNPAVWLLYILANRDMELACDEAVVRRLGDPAAYARTLLNMEEARAGLYACFAQSPMEKRIQTMMNFQKRRPPALLTACALLAAVCVTTAFATSAPQKPMGAVGSRVYTWENDVDLSAQGGQTPLGKEPVSRTVAAEWAEVLAPYLPLGLEYTFDDPDGDGNGLRMTYRGREVRGILDGDTWITEHVGSGLFDEDAGELYAVYEDGALVGLEFAPEEEQARWSAQREEAGAMIWPVEGLHISNGFGRRWQPGGEGSTFHSGVDITGEAAGIDGAPVYAAMDGTVTEAGYDARLGNYVLLSHADGLETLYGCCRSVEVAAGDAVTRGTVIAAVGSTGRSTGPHLHFEIRRDGEAQDPLDYFKAVIFSFSGQPAQG